MNTAYIIVIASCFIIFMIGGILTYIFREQVSNSIQAEMIADIRSYNPDDPEAKVTKVWDATQEQLSCCGLMTEQVSLSWEMWRYNKVLNPSSQFEVVPTSCCMPGQECMVEGKVVVEKVMTGDCMMLALEYVQNQSRMLGSAAFAISCFLIIGVVSTFSLFKSIV